jgi:hypothetical protein
MSGAAVLLARSDGQQVHGTPDRSSQPGHLVPLLRGQLADQGGWGGESLPSSSSTPRAAPPRSAVSPARVPRGGPHGVLPPSSGEPPRASRDRRVGRWPLGSSGGMPGRSSSHRPRLTRCKPLRANSIRAICTTRMPTGEDGHEPSPTPATPRGRRRTPRVVGAEGCVSRATRSPELTRFSPAAGSCGS